MDEGYLFIHLPSSSLHIVFCFFPLFFCLCLFVMRSNLCTAIIMIKNFYHRKKITIGYVPKKQNKKSGVPFFVVVVSVFCLSELLYNITVWKPG